MATKSKTLAVGTAYAEILAGAVGMEVIAFALQFTNTTQGPRTLTLSHYVQAAGVAVETVTEIAAGVSMPWPKLALQPGDTLQLKADAVGVNALVSFDVDDGTTPVATGLTPRGEYSALADYSANDFVQAGGAAYVSLTDANIGNDPATSPAEWMLFASVPQALIDAAVASAVSSLIDGAPGALDTLNELAAALGDDPNFAATLATQISARALASVTITGAGLLGGQGGDLTGSRVFTLTAATGAQQAAGTANDVVSTPASLAAALDPLDITWASTLSPGFASRAIRRVPLAGNTTFSAPTGMKKGEIYQLWLDQDGTGGRTGSWNAAAYDWGSANLPTLSTAAGKRDIVTLICKDEATQACHASIGKGFTP